MIIKSLPDKKTLEQTALNIRLDIIREMKSNKGGHIGGSFDLAEVLSVIYNDFLRIDVKKPKSLDRDFMILSKGHAGPALYATLALKGIIPDSQLDNLNNINSLLPGHCDRNKVLGADASTGSLGQGLSIAAGVALGAKIKNSDQRIFCITGDGESAEGQIWEAAQFASHHKLDNLISFLDFNNMQIDGTVEEVMSLGDPVKKYQAFGWNAVEVDGHDVVAIQNGIKKAIENKNNKPTMIVLKTIKGYGAKCITEMKNNHCIGLSDELLEKIMNELNQQAKILEMEVH